MWEWAGLYVLMEVVVFMLGLGLFLCTFVGLSRQALGLSLRSLLFISSSIHSAIRFPSPSLFHTSTSCLDSSALASCDDTKVDMVSERLENEARKHNVSVRMSNNLTSSIVSCVGIP